MLAKLGHKVMTLTRVAVGPITLKGLGIGEYRPLSSFEIDLLRKVAAGLALPGPRFADRRPARPPTRGAARARGSPDEPAPTRPARPEAPAPPRGHQPSAAPGRSYRAGLAGPRTGPRRDIARPGTPADGTAASASTSRGKPSFAATPRSLGCWWHPTSRRARGSSPPLAPRCGRPPRMKSKSLPCRRPPPPSPRTPPRPRPTGTQPPVPPTRRIIGMEGGGRREGRPDPRPRPPKRSFPRAALGKRRPRPRSSEEPEE